MIRIVEYVPQMQGDFKARKGDEAVIYMINRLSRLGIHHEIAAIYYEKEILAIGCIFEEHQGMWQLIMGFSHNAFTKPMSHRSKELIRTARKLLDITFERDIIRRLQTYVVADSHKNFKFATWMGFKPSGYLERWGPHGEDYWLMARVK